MAQIDQPAANVPQQRSRRTKLQTAHVDMTPMVDLACLLLTFFMLTTAFTKPKVMEIVMPDKSGETRPVNPGRALTIILAENNQVFFYNGLADPSEGRLPTMIKSNFSENGIRKVLLSRNKTLFDKAYYFKDSVARELGQYKDYPQDSLNKQLRKMRTNDNSGPLVLIKVAENVKYGNIVDVLNEMAITNVARYAVVDINTVEKKMLKDALAGVNVEVQ